MATNNTIQFCWTFGPAAKMSYVLNVLCLMSLVSQCNGWVQMQASKRNRVNIFTHLQNVKLYHLEYKDFNRNNVLKCKKLLTHKDTQEAYMQAISVYKK